MIWNRNYTLGYPRKTSVFTITILFIILWPFIMKTHRQTHALNVWILSYTLANLTSYNIYMILTENIIWISVIYLTILYFNWWNFYFKSMHWDIFINTCIEKQWNMKIWEWKLVFFLEKNVVKKFQEKYLLDCLNIF